MKNIYDISLIVNWGLKKKGLVTLKANLQKLFDLKSREKRLGIKN